MLSFDSPGDSGRRRRVQRVRADLRVVVAFRDGTKEQARVLDVSVGGMNLHSTRVPEYGEAVTLVVQLAEAEDWCLLPAVVRWFGREGFGVEFGALDPRQGRALAAFVDEAAA